MYHYIYTISNNIPKLIFDFDNYNKKYQYDVTYKNDYKVKVLSNLNELSYTIDLTYKNTSYLEEIYNTNGNLIKPLKGFVNPLSGLYPIDFNADGTYELLAYQKIAGRYNADALGYVLNKLRWKDNEFILDNQNIAIWGG